MINFGSNGFLIFFLLSTGLLIFSSWLIVTDQIAHPLQSVLPLARLSHAVERYNATDGRCIWSPRPSVLPSDASFFYASSRCGVWLHVRHWIPTEDLPPLPGERNQGSGDNPPAFWRGIALLLHSEHAHAAQQYGPALVPLLHRHHILPISLDWPGHGHSWGDRMHLVAFHDLVDDALAVLRLVRKPHVHVHGPDAPHKPPIFLVGSSLGGLVAKRVAESEPAAAFGGVFLAAPLLRLPGEEEPATRRALEIGAKLCPKCRIGPVDASQQQEGGVDLAPTVAITQPDCAGCPVTANFAVEVVKGIEEGQGTNAQLQTPLLVLHSVGDSEADIRGSEQLIAEAKSASKKLIRLEGNEHDLLSCRSPQACQALIDFIDQQLEILETSN